MTVFVHLNGKLRKEEDARISPFDHGFLYGDGIYESIRTIKGKIFDFDSHTKRLRSSARIMDIPVPWNDDELKKWVQETIEKNGGTRRNLSNGETRGGVSQEFRIRISVTRGENGFRFSSAKNPTLLITATKLADYLEHQNGVSLTKIQMNRIFPTAKAISLLPLILAKQAAEKANAFECLFLNENGFVTECSTSNILYRKGNIIFVTPEKEALSGTMQKIFLEKAKRTGYSVQEKESTPEDLQNAEEVVITNSIFGCLPVRNICGKQIQNCPGELYEKCRIDFDGDIY